MESGGLIPDENPKKGRNYLFYGWRPRRPMEKYRKRPAFF